MPNAKECNIGFRRSPGRYYSDELIRKDELELDGGLENTSSSTGNVYAGGTPLSKRPSGTPPPAFRTRPSNLSLAGQQPVQKSKSTASFLGKVAMDPDPRMKEVRSYSTPSLRSNSSEDSVRMITGKQKAVRRQMAARLDKVPQTQVWLPKFRHNRNIRNMPRFVATFILVTAWLVG